MFDTTPEKTRFYAACLASYNAGILHGAWIDATRDEDEMSEQVQAMLEASMRTALLRQKKCRRLARRSISRARRTFRISKAPSSI